MKANVLIAEDDTDLGNLLKQYLEINGFLAHRVYNGEEARQELKINQYDILIIDIMMPKEDGFTLAEKLKQQYPNLPFLFVTARKMKEDILYGLKLGADDYITKPFDADELILRIQNILRRLKSQTSSLQFEELVIGQFTFEPENQRLYSTTSEKILTEKESQLLHFMYTNRSRLIKRKEILAHLWNDSDFFNGRSMDVFVSRLRKYLSEDSAIQIESIRGIGFRFHC